MGGGHLPPLCGHHWSSWVTARSYRLNNAVVVARHSPRMIAALVFSMNQLGHAGGKPKPRMAQRPRRPRTSGGRVQNGAVPVKGSWYRIGPESVGRLSISGNHVVTASKQLKQLRFLSSQADMVSAQPPISSSPIVR